MKTLSAGRPLLAWATILTVLATAGSVLTGCSLKPVGSHTIRIELPSFPDPGAAAIERGNRKAASNLMIATDGFDYGYDGNKPQPTSRRDFRCFALNVRGPGIPLNPGMNCTNPAEAIGKFAGFFPINQDGSTVMEISVPAGPERELEVVAFMLEPGATECPTGLEQSNGTGEPYIVGRAKFDLFADQDVEVLASYDPLTTKPAFRSCDGGDRVAIPPTSIRFGQYPIGSAPFSYSPQAMAETARLTLDTATKTKLIKEETDMSVPGYVPTQASTENSIVASPCAGGGCNRPIIQLEFDVTDYLGQKPYLRLEVGGAGNVDPAAITCTPMTDTEAARVGLFNGQTQAWIPGGMFRSTCIDHSSQNELVSSVVVDRLVNGVTRKFVIAQVESTSDARPAVVSYAMLFLMTQPDPPEVMPPPDTAVVVNTLSGYTASFNAGALALDTFTDFSAMGSALANGEIAKIQTFDPGQPSVDSQIASINTATGTGNRAAMQLWWDVTDLAAEMTANPFAKIDIEFAGGSVDAVDDGFGNIVLQNCATMPAGTNGVHVALWDRHLSQWTRIERDNGTIYPRWASFSRKIADIAYSHADSRKYVVLRVEADQDSGGCASTVAIAGASLKLMSAAEPLGMNPSVTTAYVGSGLFVSAFGGVGPYDYSVSGASWSPVYGGAELSGMTAGSPVTITVTDFLGNSVGKTIAISESPIQVTVPSPQASGLCTVFTVNVPGAQNWDLELSASSYAHFFTDNTCSNRIFPDASGKVIATVPSNSEVTLAFDSAMISPFTLNVSHPSLGARSVTIRFPTVLTFGITNGPNAGCDLLTGTLSDDSGPLAAGSPVSLTLFYSVAVTTTFGFYSDSSCSTPWSSLDIAAGSNSGSLYIQKVGPDVVTINSSSPSGSISY